MATSSVLAKRFSELVAQLDPHTAQKPLLVDVGALNPTSATFSHGSAAAATWRF